MTAPAFFWLNLDLQVISKSLQWPARPSLPPGMGRGHRRPRTKIMDVDVQNETE